MGTNYDLESKQACLCGEGAFKVYWVISDYPGTPPSDGRYEGKIECDKCKLEYELMNQDNAIIAVRRADIAEQEEKEAKFHEVSQQLMASEEVQAILKRYKMLIAGRPSVKNANELLRSAGIYGSLTTASKRDEQILTRLVHNIRVDSLPIVMKQLAMSDARLSAEIERVLQLRASQRYEGTAVYSYK